MGFDVVKTLSSDLWQSGGLPSVEQGLLFITARGPSDDWIRT